MTTLAVSVPLGGDVGSGLDLVRKAGDWGYGACWASDASGADAVSQLGAIAATTDLDLGIVTPPDSRTAFVLGMTAVSLAQLSQGSFILGLGTWQMPGEARTGAASLSHVREMATALRPVLRGERSTYDGDHVQLGGYRPHASPPHPVPLYVAGNDPQSLTLAGEIADGVCLDGAAAGELPDLVARCRGAAERASQDESPAPDRGFGIVVRVYCTLTDAGGTEELTPHLADHGLVAGDEEEVGRGIASYRDAGATVVVVHAIAREPDDVARTLQAAASAWT